MMEYKEFDIQNTAKDEGYVSGETIVCSQPVSFLAECNVKKSEISLDGETYNFKNKVLVIPGGKGSTAAWLKLYSIGKRDEIKALITEFPDEVLIFGASMGDIPYCVVPNATEEIESGSKVEIDFKNGKIKVFESGSN